MGPVLSKQVKSCWAHSSSPKVTSALGHPGCTAVPAQGVGQSPVYRYCSRAPKATGLICRQSRKERSETTTQHELTALPEAGILSQGRWTHQRVPENHDALALPLGVQHVGEVGTASTEDTAMGPEWLSVYHKDHITVDALFQKTGKSQKGCCIIQATTGSPRPLSTLTHLNPLRVHKANPPVLQAPPPAHRCRKSS